VPDNDYRGFLKRRVEGLEEQVKGGKFIDKHGNDLGSHNGYPFYTIGQRKGLGGGFITPKYVTEILPDSNTVVLGEVDDLLRNGMNVGKINLQKYEHITDGMESKVMVRYLDSGTLANISNATSDTMRVDFLANVRGIAPGQSAVFYEGDDVLGGGIIQVGGF